jgi:hypothetical protein
MTIGQDTPMSERVSTVADLFGAGVIQAEEAYDRGIDTPGSHIISRALIAGQATDFFPALPEGHVYSVDVLAPQIEAAMEAWFVCEGAKGAISACIIGDMFKFVARWLINGGPSNDAAAA